MQWMQQLEHWPHTRACSRELGGLVGAGNHPTEGPFIIHSLPLCEMQGHARLSVCATPQPSIRPLGKFLGTSDPRVLLLISFGERVLAANPLHLFGAEGLSRWGRREHALGECAFLKACCCRPACAAAMTAKPIALQAVPWRCAVLSFSLCRLDVLYDVAAGDLYLAGTVLNASEPCIITGAYVLLLRGNSCNRARIGFLLTSPPNVISHVAPSSWLACSGGASRRHHRHCWPAQPSRLAANGLSAREQQLRGTGQGSAVDDERIRGHVCGRRAGRQHAQPRGVL